MQIKAKQLQPGDVCHFPLHGEFWSSTPLKVVGTSERTIYSTRGDRTVVEVKYTIAESPNYSIARFDPDTDIELKTDRPVQHVEEKVEEKFEPAAIFQLLP